MNIKGLITEDFVNYKKPAMTVMFPCCTFKCGTEYCQNSTLAKEKNIDLEINDIVKRYIDNPITEAIVMQGLEPFDSWEDLFDLIIQVRKSSIDDIVIYTGYDKNEIEDYIKVLCTFENIIVKYGRYIPGNDKHYDKILGVYLASDNQYAEKIS